MARNSINEDQPLPKYLIRFSEKFQDKIRELNSYNRDNSRGLSDWQEDFKGFLSLLSNPAIAWGNNHNIEIDSDGVLKNKVLGYEVAYQIRNDTKVHKDYIFIANVILRPRLSDFDLELPDYIIEQKRKNFLFNKTTKHMSDDEYCNILIERYDTHWHDLFR